MSECVSDYPGSSATPGYLKAEEGVCGQGAAPLGSMPSTCPLAPQRTGSERVCLCAERKCEQTLLRRMQALGLISRDGQ